MKKYIISVLLIGIGVLAARKTSSDNATSVLLAQNIEALAQIDIRITEVHGDAICYAEYYESETSNIYRCITCDWTKGRPGILIGHCRW